MVSSKTVLIVAAPSLVQRLLREILETHEYEVLYERSGYASLAIGQDNAGGIDMSLVDWNYRGNRGGLAVATSLRELSPEMATLFFSAQDRKLMLIPDPAEEHAVEFSPASFLSQVVLLTVPAYYDFSA